jgi:mono/diheme cytochrome c family protein
MAGRFEMKKSGFVALFAAVAAVASGAAQGQTDEVALRAGKNIAVTTCIACHVVSRDQDVKPVQLGIPGFEEIANQPVSTLDSLREAMKSRQWHDPVTANLLPMAGMSDGERAQVAAYILSLRRQR